MQISNLLHLLSTEIRMIHQLHSGLLFRNLDVFHKLLFGLVSRDFHDGDGRNACQIHICRTAAACRMGLYQVAFIDQIRLLFPVLDV